MLSKLCSSCRPWGHLVIFRSLSRHSWPPPNKGNMIIGWMRQPLNYYSLVKTLKLSVISFAVCYKTVRKTYCQHIVSAGLRRTEYLKKQYSRAPEPSLSLSDVLSLVKPYVGYFAASVVCAILVALLNIQLPIVLGDLINSISSLIKESSVRNFQILRPVACKLLSLYAVQAILTCCYITLLSIVGERIAGDLRVRLFSRLLLQVR
ncbi:hypothetical protein AB6A40_001411 [Gnathostoma spinigerum]|uniref:ABC transmembrane type-1 domain-containing protein n=1 Tax=Gnathostoma spinigerum TaxID=75299 RepID=A0ABD6EDD4_9BILA